MKADWRCVVVLALLSAGGPLPELAAAASITFESATMGPANQPSAPSVSANQMVAWRFRTTKPMAVTEVGGHLGGVNGSLFAAIVSLTALDAMPQGAPLSANSTVASAVFTPPAASDDVRVLLSALLAPGPYALVFGSGQFTALGSGLIPNAQQTNIAPTLPASYITWRQTLPGVFNWTQTTLNNLRFVVVGSEVAGATDFNLDGSLNGDDLSVWRAGFGGGVGGISRGDGDGDGDVDGNDFLLWQRNLAPAPSGAAAAVPESTTLALAVMGAVTLFTRRRRA